MGIAERKERDKQEMKELILQTAKKMFIEEGYEKTSLRKLAEKIEYSPATIYLYYADKDELFFAIQEQAFEMFFLEMSVVASYPDPFERLTHMGRIYMEFSLKNTELYDLMFLMDAPMNSKMACEDWGSGHRSWTFLKEAVQACIDAGYFKTQDTLNVSRLIFSFIHGLITTYIRRRSMMEDNCDGLTPEESIQEAFVFFQDVLKKL